MSAGISLAIGDLVKIVYYPQVTVTDVCSLVSANGICYSYPIENTIIIKATSAQSSYNFVLGGMTNLYKYQGDKLYTEVWKVATGTISNIFYTSYTVGTIVTDPVSNNPLAITFETTLTPDYQLSYGFNNIARIEISYLMQNKHI